MIDSLPERRPCPWGHLSDRISNGLLITLTSKATGLETFEVVCNALSVEATCQCASKLKRICWEMKGKLPLLQIRLINLEQFYFFNTSYMGKISPRQFQFSLFGIDAFACQKNVNIHLQGCRIVEKFIAKRDNLQFLQFLEICLYYIYTNGK